MRTIVIICALLIVTGCSTIRRAERQYNDNPRIAELLESYYITVENPENNGENEQDSIKTLIRQSIKR